MRINTLKAIAKAAVRGAAVLLFGAGVATAQQQINLTAAPSIAYSPRRIRRANVGLQLRRRRDWVHRNLRSIQIKPARRMVAGCDHRSSITRPGRPHHQPDQQPVVCERQ